MNSEKHCPSGHLKCTTLFSQFPTGIGNKTYKALHNYIHRNGTCDANLVAFTVDSVPVCYSTRQRCIEACVRAE